MTARTGEMNHTHTGCRPARSGQDCRDWREEPQNKREAGPPDPARTPGRVTKQPQTHPCADPGVASSGPKGDVLASTGRSPGAVAESPVGRRTVWETGPLSDRVNMRKTTAAHAARDQRRTDPQGSAPSRGPEWIQRGASPASPPRRGPVAGTMSLVLGWPPHAPRSRPVNQGARAPGRGRHNGYRKADWHTASDRTGPDRAHQRRATRHAREARRWPHPRHRTRCKGTTTNQRNTHHKRKA